MVGWEARRRRTWQNLPRRHWMVNSCPTIEPVLTLMSLADFDARVAKLKSVDADEKLPTLPELPSLGENQRIGAARGYSQRH